LATLRLELPRYRPFSIGCLNAANVNDCH